MSLLYKQLVEVGWLFVVVYALTFFFSNFGPNTTTYIVASEAYPTEIRATCHGISSAAGKIGAIIGASVFAPFSEAFGYKYDPDINILGI